MAEVMGVPLLEHLLRHFRGFGFHNFCLLTGYKGDFVERYFGSGDSLGVSVEYSHESSPLGTGGAVRNAIAASASDRFLVVNGDTFFQCDPTLLVEFSTGPASIGLRYENDAGRYGRVEIDSEGRVLTFAEKSPDAGGGLINAGIYLLDRSTPIPSGVVSLEDQVFPEMLRRETLSGLPLSGRFVDIGLPESYERAQQDLASWVAQGAEPAVVATLGPWRELRREPRERWLRKLRRWKKRKLQVIVCSEYQDRPCVLEPIADRWSVGHTIEEAVWRSAGTVGFDTRTSVWVSSDPGARSPIAGLRSSA